MRKPFRLMMFNMFNSLSLIYMSLICICHTFGTATTATLEGEHVCQRDETYKVNVTEYVPRNVTVRSFQWCMQVPPRCSTFTHRIINETHVVEEVRVRTVRVCCEGYEPSDTNDRCELSCGAKCQHGKCNMDNKCYCNPGYRGDFCEKECDATRWGRYCRYQCDCQKGTCDRALGLCHCPAGWTGVKCEIPCPMGYYGVKCLNICDCAKDQICSPEDGVCSNKLKIAVLKKYYTFEDTPTTDSNKQRLGPPKEPQTTIKMRKIEMYLLTTERTPRRGPITTTEDDRLIKPILPIETIMADEQKEPDEPEEELALIPSASETVVQTIRAPANFSKPSNNDPQPQHNRSQTMNFAMIAFSCIITFAVVGFLVITRILKQRQATPPKNPSTSTVTPKSIFHTPLPEPPQSPFFESPLCAHYHARIGENEVAFNPPQIIENEIVDICYDQLPPTTGSYKAAIVVEPPPSLPLENVYDEIPCWQPPPADLAELYANVRQENKTKF